MTSPLQQKLKITGPSVVTANRLADGAVVYRTADGTWTTGISTAPRWSTHRRSGDGPAGRRQGRRRARGRPLCCAGQA